MSNFGYTHGNPFGDPDQFTRSTGEDELDRFNQWMRSQPWWAAAQHTPGAVEQHLAQMGIRLPDAFHVDEAGNLNQKSRVKRNLAIAGVIGAGALTAGGALGVGPLAGVFGGGAGAGAAGAGEAAASGVLPSTTIGTGFIPAIEGGAGMSSAGIGAGAGAAGTAAAAGGSSVAGKIKNAVTGGTGKDLLKDLALIGGGNFLNGLGDSLFQQKRHSFEGTAADPVNIVSGVQRRIEGAAGPLHDRAFGPVSTPNAYVQPVNGLTGVDPAYTDRSLLTRGGNGQPDELAQMQQSLRILGMKV